ncbi:MAG: hypothetical protein IIC74_09155 [Bacteroidetes bacterium]|nr:hypothetical protein [Bacteroidota bacterium]
MTLQKLMIQKIDAFCGRDQLTLKIKALLKICHPSGKHYLESCMFCLNSIYITKVDVVGHTIENKQTNIDTIIFLEKHVKTNNYGTALFLIDLINFKLDYVKGIKTLAS